MEAPPDPSGPVTFPPPSHDPIPRGSTRRVVVVLGMHRSGTSLIAGCLQRLGVDFGPRLMPPDANNPRGYFEHNDVVNLHDRLLLALDRSWDDATPLPDQWWQRTELLAPYRARILDVLRRDFSGTPLWGLKDPRLCRLLPWWDSLWPETAARPLFLLVQRSPAAVAASLSRRDGMSPAQAYLLWLRHTLEAEKATRPYERLLLDFSSLVQAEDAALQPVLRRLGLSGGIPDDRAPMVDPNLGQAGSSQGSDSLPSVIREAEAALHQGLSGAESTMQVALDQLAACLPADLTFSRTVAETVHDLERQLATTRKQARWYEAEWRKAQSRADKLNGRLEKIKRDRQA